MIGWRGEAFFGEGWFAFRGAAADNEPHAHAALQLVASVEGKISIEGPDCNVVRAQGLLVAPERGHRLLPSGALTLVLIEPDHAVAPALKDGIESKAIVSLTEQQVAHLTRDCALSELLDGLVQNVPVREIDARLEAALSLLGPEAERLRILAGAVGLSEVRLRSLARQELGVPMSKLSALKKVIKAAEAIAGGASLSEAAVDAGFADQAHLTRTFKQVIGLTPGQAARPLR